MMLIENEEPEERSTPDLPSAPNDELIKSMLASNKLIGDMQENMNKMQNQISDGQSKDRENQDKYLGPPQQSQKGYDPVPGPAGLE